MKLQKRLSRIYKGKKYYKYLLIIPERDIKKAGFKKGEELKCKAKKGQLKFVR